MVDLLPRVEREPRERGPVVAEADAQVLALELRDGLGVGRDELRGAAVVQLHRSLPVVMIETDLFFDRARPSGSFLAEGGRIATLDIRKTTTIAAGVRYATTNLDTRFEYHPSGATSRKDQTWTRSTERNGAGVRSSVASHPAQPPLRSHPLTEWTSLSN